MKILISSDGVHAHFYQRVAWVNAFRAIGWEAHLWNCKQISPFDAFDTFEPDVFLGQSYNLNDGLIKCILERPHLKVGLRAADWGSQTKHIDHQKYNVLTITEEEVKILHKLQNKTNQISFVHIHYDEDAIQETHDFFEKQINIKAISVPMCADVYAYDEAQEDHALRCDIGFVGGYWPYKGLIVDQYLTPLCHPIGKYNIKIFGNQPWPHINQYCGVLSDPSVKNLFVSAKICPNLSEPHAQEYGFDMNERIFKILCAGGFCISDRVNSFCKMFENNGVVFADSPDDFRDKINYYLDNDSERREIAKAGQIHVLENHTNFHRISEMLGSFGFKRDAVKSLEALKTHKKGLKCLETLA